MVILFIEIRNFGGGVDLGEGCSDYEKFIEVLIKMGLKFSID